MPVFKSVFAVWLCIFYFFISQHINQILKFRPFSCYSADQAPWTAGRLLGNNTTSVTLSYVLLGEITRQPARLSPHTDDFTPPRAVLLPLLKASLKAGVELIEAPCRQARLQPERIRQLDSGENVMERWSCWGRGLRELSAKLLAATWWKKWMGVGGRMWKVALVVWSLAKNPVFVKGVFKMYIFINCHPTMIF